MISDDVCSHFKASKNGLTNVPNVQSVPGQMEKKSSFDLKKMNWKSWKIHGPMGHCSRENAPQIVD